MSLLSHLSTASSDGRICRSVDEGEIVPVVRCIWSDVPDVVVWDSKNIKTSRRGVDVSMVYFDPPVYDSGKTPS